MIHLRSLTMPPCGLPVFCATLLLGGAVLALAVGGAAGGQEAENGPVTPWPPQYKAGGTAADVLGPDGRTWFPNWTAVGVQGGIPDVKPFAPIEQFGGRADDDADDGQALQDACNAAGLAGGGAVLLGEGTYYLDRKVLITHGGVVIRGQGRDRTKVVIRYSGTDNRITDGMIVFAGGPDGERWPLAADARRGDTALSLEDATGVSEGDWLMVEARGTPRWRLLIESRSRFNPRLAMVRVEAINGNTLTINQPLRLDFPLVDESSAYKVAPVQGCGIEDLHLTQVNRQPKICTVLFIRSVNCWGRRVSVDWTGRMPLYGSHSKWMEVRDCEFNEAQDTGGAGTGYVGWQYSFDCLMENVTARNMRHAPNLDWGCSGNVFRNSTFYYSDAQTHSGWCNENLFENCVIVDPRGRPAGGGSYGHGFWATPPSDNSHGPNGPRNVFYNCDFQNAGDHVVFDDDMVMYGPTGLVLGGMNENWLFFYNRILSRGPGILLRGASFDHIIKGNVFMVKDGFPAVLVEEPARCSGLELAGNVVYGGNGALLGGGERNVGLDRDNQVLGPADNWPARPQPEVPSIYEWQQRFAKSP
jgi:hypothetical protein